MADRKAFDAIFGKQSALTPDPLARPDSPTARFLAERYAVGDAPTASGYYGDYRTDPENKVEERGIILPGAKYSDGKIHPAWPAIVHDAWQGMKAFETADPTDNSPEATDRLSKAAFDAAGLAMTGSLAVPRPANAVGTFGGKLAKTADHAKLAEAEKMAAAGADRQSIWDATGWFQGPDQKWRYEISDHVDYPTGEGAAYRPGKLKSEILDQGASREGLEKSGYQGRLNEVLAHKELFDAYPDLAKSTWASVPPDKMVLPGMGGVWRGQQLGMQVNSDIAPSFVRGRSITLHEIQHGVQDAEGFTRGSNPEMFKHDIGQLQSTLHAIEDARFLKEQATKRGMTPDEVVPIIEDLYGRKVGLDGYKKFVGYDEGKLSQWADTHRKLLNDASDPNKAYHRTAGEVEARAVQKRMDLTPEQRQARPPWLDYDVPEKDQIVRFGNSGTQQSAGDFLKERYGSSTSTALGGDGAITLPPPSLEPKPMAMRQLHDIADATYLTPYAIDPVQTVPLASLKGSHYGTEKIAPLAAEIKANGWLEPLVVDRDGNVIEGQHRLRALQQLGVQDVPVHRIREILPDDTASAIQAAAKGAGVHREQAAAITRDIAQIIDKEGIGELELYDAPRGFEKAWTAAVAEAQRRFSPSTVDRTAASTPPTGSLNQTTSPQDFLRERYGADQPEPLRGYHGASMPYEGDAYNPRKSQYKAFFGAERPELANNFARSYGDNPRVYPVEVSPSANMFNPANPEHSAKIVAAFDKNPGMLSGFLMGKDTLRRMLAEGDGGLMESTGVQQWLRKNKFDGWRFQDTAAPPSADDKRGAFGMLKPGFVRSSTTGDLLYSNPKESAALPSAVKALENRALPMDLESKLARAREMGFDLDNPLNHNSRTPDLREFRPVSKSTNDMGLLGPVETERHGTFFSDNPSFSDEYGPYPGQYVTRAQSTAPISDNLRLDFVDSLDAFGPDRDIWMQAKHGIKEPWQLFEGKLGEKFVQWLKAKGYDSASFPEETTTRGGGYVEGKTTNVFDPENIRRTDAAFDPAMSHSAKLLASNPKTSAAVPVGVKAVEGQQMKSYPLAPRSEWYGEANFETTGGKMRVMSPDEFLKNARPLAIDDVSRENIDILKAHMQDGRTLDPLQLYPGGKEDGRHRAYAAKELGIKQVPVIVFDPAKQALGRAVKN